MINRRKKRVPYPHLLECEYYREYVYDCPVRGRVKQLIKVKKYRSPFDAKALTSKMPIGNLIDDHDDELSICSEKDLESSEE